MEQSTASRVTVSDQSQIGQRRTQTQADTDAHERDLQIRSLITPGIASSLGLPEWLTKLFRRKDAPAAR
jgi:hypothetical protein